MLFETTWIKMPEESLTSVVLLYFPLKYVNFKKMKKISFKIYNTYLDSTAYKPASSIFDVSEQDGHRLGQ